MKHDKISYHKGRWLSLRMACGRQAKGLKDDFQFLSTAGVDTINESPYRQASFHMKKTPHPSHA